MSPISATDYSKTHHGRTSHRHDSKFIWTYLRIYYVIPQSSEYLALENGVWEKKTNSEDLHVATILVSNIAPVRRHNSLNSSRHRLSRHIAAIPAIYF